MTTKTNDPHSPLRDNSPRPDADAALYIVATPIGNLDDITLRALSILQSVDVVAAEDTRHTKKLFHAHGIDTPLMSLHAHNEQERTAQLLGRITAGQSVALVSDAGTPLISDPGYSLVSEARLQGVKVVPVPGACAAVTALCASGLPSTRFCFVGFLSVKAGARRSELVECLESMPEATLVLYESPRRVLGLLQLLQTLVPERQICLAKELTKTFENFMLGTADELYEFLAADETLQKGEWVVLIGPNQQVVEDVVTETQLDAVAVAASNLPLKKACELVATLTDQKKNALYKAYIARRG